MPHSDSIPYSKHVFILPFTIKTAPHCQPEKAQAWKQLDKSLPNLEDPHLDYAYQRYFNTEAKELVAQSSVGLVENYHYTGLEAGSYYRISIDKSATDSKEPTVLHYDLQIDFVMLRIFPCLEAGFLLIAVENRDYPTIQQMKEINQYGRRIYDPFLPLDVSEAPTELEIYSPQGEPLKGEINPSSEQIRLRKAPHQLLSSYFKGFDIFPEKSQDSPNALEIIVDDRMFVHSVLLNQNSDSSEPSLTELIKKRLGKLTNTDCEESTQCHSDDNTNSVKNEAYHKVDYTKLVTKTSSLSQLSQDEKKALYAITYVDTDYSTCQGQDLMDKLLADSVYSRWSNYGSVYLSTQHSFILLANKGIPSYLVDYFMTEYLDLVLIVLSQRVGLLHFSKRSGQAVKSDAQEILRLHEDFITFKNQFLLPEVSPQEQAVELYALLQSSLYIDKHLAILDNQLDSLNNISQIKQGISSQKRDRELNFILAIFAIITLSLDITNFLNNVPNKLMLLPTLIVLITVVVLIYCHRDKITKLLTGSRSRR